MKDQARVKAVSRVVRFKNGKGDNSETLNLSSNKSVAGDNSSTLINHAPEVTMRTLAWNCRVAGRAPTVRGLRELIRESTPEKVFLLETKSKSPRINKIK